MSKVKQLIRQEWFILSAIVLLAVVLRLLFIERRGIWYDDAFSILLAKQSLPQIFSGTAADTMPPMYYTLLHFWMLISSDIGWIRGLNLLLNLLLMLYVFLFVRKVTSKEAGYISLFLISISPFLIYHSQEIRMYMVLVFCQTAYMYYFVSWMDDNRSIGNILGMVLFGAGALYSHNLAIFGLVTPGVYLLLKKLFKPFLQWGGWIVCSFVLFIPWLVFVPGQIEKIQTAFWTPRPGFLEIIQSIYSLLSYIPQPTTWMMISGVLCFQVLVMLFWTSWKVRKQQSHIGLILLIITFIPAILFLVSYLMRPVYVARGFIFSLVGLYVLAGILIWKFWQAGLDKIFLVLFIALAAVSLPFQYKYADFPRSPYKEACQYLQKEMTGNGQVSLVLHDNKLSAFPCIVYQPDLQQSFLGDEPGSHNDTYAYASQVAMGLYPINSAQELITDKNEVYFVVFTRAIEEYTQIEDGKHPVLAYLSSELTEKEVIQFNDLEVYHYER